MNLADQKCDTDASIRRILMYDFKKRIFLFYQKKKKEMETLKLQQI